MAKSRARIGDDNNPLMKNKTDAVLDGFEQVSQSTSQPANQTTQSQGSRRRRRSSSQPSNQSTSQQADKSESQQPEIIALRKATYQIDTAVLEELDKAHLRLQLELGKKNTPYKEVIVEEAIARILAELEKNPARMQKVLVKRQGLR